MQIKIDKSIYLDYTKPLSYNSFLTFIVTERGLGKSYGAKKFVAKRFINKGKQFVYIRRYKTELKESMMKNGNPQEIVMNMLRQNATDGNPMAQNLLQMVNNRDIQGIENMARNVARERGVDYDKEFNNFKQMFRNF